MNNNREVFNLEAFKVPAPYQGSAQGAPEPNDITPSPAVVDLKTKPIEDMTDEELEAYINGQS